MPYKLTLPYKHRANLVKTLAEVNGCQIKEHFQIAILHINFFICKVVNASNSWKR